MKKYLALMLALAMVFALVACGKTEAPAQTTTAPAETTTETPADTAPAAPEYVILFATNSSADPENPQNVGCAYFEQIVEERSNGRIDIEIHGQAALGGAREIVEGVQLGTIHMGDVENGPMDSFVPAAAVWNLPYLFTTLEEVHKIQASDIGQNIQAGFEAVGIKHLAFNDGGFRYFTSKGKALASAADFPGMKVRVMESPIYIGMIESMGGSATPMAFAELYTGLQQGTVDAQENPLDLIYAQAYYEVQDYVSLSEHLYYPRQHIINLDFFNSLPADLQEIIAQASIDACNYQNEYFVEYTAKMLTALQEKGMEVVEFDKPSAQAATSTIWPDYYEMIGSGDAAAGEAIVNRIASGEFQ